MEAILLRLELRHHQLSQLQPHLSLRRRYRSATTDAEKTLVMAEALYMLNVFTELAR